MTSVDCLLMTFLLYNSFLKRSSCIAFLYPHLGRILLSCRHHLLYPIERGPSSFSFDAANILGVSFVMVRHEPVERSSENSELSVSVLSRKWRFSVYQKIPNFDPKFSITRRGHLTLLPLSRVVYVVKKLVSRGKWSFSDYSLYPDCDFPGFIVSHNSEEHQLISIPLLQVEEVVISLVF